MDREDMVIWTGIIMVVLPLTVAYYLSPIPYLLGLYIALDEAGW
jgi:hypothetical protein